MSAILVVDDEPLILQLLSTILRPFGREVICASSIQSATWRIKAVDQLDLAIVDYVLPDGRGLVLAAELAIARQIPVIVVSGMNSNDIDLPSGADLHFVPKPFDLRAVTNQVAKLLARREHPEPVGI